MSQAFNGEVNWNWRQKGESFRCRGMWKFYNPRPCSQCGMAADIELGGGGVAGSGVRWCVPCLKKEKKW